MSLCCKTILFALPLLFLASVQPASADEVGDKRFFYINSQYDYAQREKTSAVLVKSTSKLYFYIDESWWNIADQSAQKENLNSLGTEFENNVAPVLSTLLGREWSPGIDNDIKITVLLHPMRKEAGGYFRYNDEYEKIQITDSNEREMVYLNADYLDNQSLIKSFLAHEFVHLVTFNEKNKKRGVEEEVWLDEARAEYVSTLLGYNDTYQGSVLEKRVQYFSENPSGSLTEWNNTKYDYGRTSVFIHYLADQYGFNILGDSLRSQKSGIESINYALLKNGFKKTFSDIFEDWLIAVLINDCNYGSTYCYLDKNLKNLYINPLINFLPVTGSSTLTMADNSKIWSGIWYKIIGGGGGSLEFVFDGQDTSFFKVTYIMKNQFGGYVVKSMELDKLQRGQISVENFGKEANALFIIPHLQYDKNISYTGSFSWSASTKRAQSDSDEIKRLLAIIDDLKQKITDLLTEKQRGSGEVSCKLNGNLYFGMRNNSEVRCLQNFLKAQGAGIYPEGLVSGNFGKLTRQAVIKFQEKYASEILTPLGLLSGTGYVGPSTGAKINQMLGG